MAKLTARQYSFERRDRNRYRKVYRYIRKKPSYEFASEEGFSVIAGTLDFSNSSGPATYIFTGTSFTEIPVVTITAVDSEGNSQSNVSAYINSITTNSVSIGTSAPFTGKVHFIVMSQDEGTDVSTPAIALPVMQSLGNLNGGDYTYTDTAGVALSSYSYNSVTDTHTFSTNTIGSANETYSLISGTNFTSPKWHKLLTYEDDTPVLAGDAFTLSVRVDNISASVARQYIVALAVIQNPTATNITNSLRPSGIYAITTAGALGMGVVADNVGVSGVVSNMTNGVGSVSFTGSPLLYKTGGAVISQSSTTAGSNARSDGNIWSVASTQQLSIGVFLSTNGTVTTTGGDFSMRIKYTVTKLS